eukprot:725528-Pyramimonas_sp.AAC.1
MSSAICSGSWAHVPHKYIRTLRASRPEAQSCFSARGAQLQTPTAVCFLNLPKTDLILSGATGGF